MFGSGCNWASGKTAVGIIMAAVTIFLLSVTNNVRAATYNEISVDGDPNDWAADEIFTNIAGLLTDFRITWDANNLYFGFNGGNADDKYVIAIDIDPGSLNSGYAASWAGVTFSDFGRPDYIVEYSLDNVLTYNVTAANVDFARIHPFLEIAIPRSELGNLPVTAGVGIYMYVANSEDEIVAFLGSPALGNPASGTGETPVTQFYFATTDNGRSPNSYSRYQAHIFAGKMVLAADGDQFHDIILDGGTLDGPTDGLLQVARDFRYEDGVFNLNNSELHFNGNGAISGSHNSGITFSHVTIVPEAVLNAAANFRVTGDFTNDGGTMTATAGTARFTGSSNSLLSGDLVFCDLALEKDTGFNTNFGSAILTVRGSISKTSSGTIDPASSTVIMTGDCGLAPYEITGAGQNQFHHLRIASGADMMHPAEAGAVSIRLTGDFENNGSFTQEIGKYFLFNSGSVQTLSGSGTTALGRLVIQNSTTVNAGSHNFSLAGDPIQVASGSTLNGELNTITFIGNQTRLRGAGTYTLNNVVIANGATLEGRDQGDRIWSIAGNWTNDGTFVATEDTVIFNGSSEQLIGGSSATAFHNLTVSSGASVVLPADITAVSFNNHGRITQVQPVVGSGDVTFAGIGDYGGVILNNGTGNDLGLTSVAIRGEQPCETDDSTVQRCFDISPENETGRNATITFFWHESELNGYACATLNAYRWHGSGWDDALTLDPTYGDANGRDCSTPVQSLRVIGVTDFSLFALSGGVPTAVFLTTFTTSSSDFLPLILLLLILLAVIGLLLRRRLT
jgi:hypothetical protein